MSNTTICIPGAGRRRSKWYVRLKRRKHLLLWGALVVSLVWVLGYGVAKTIKHNKYNDAESASQYKVVINPKFHPKAP